MATPPATSGNAAKTDVDEGPQISLLDSSSDSDTSSNSTTSIEIVDTDSETDSIGDPDEFCRSLLNFRSLNFSPTLALNLNRSELSSDSNFQLPQPDAPKYLNLIQYDKAVPYSSQSPCKNVKPLLPLKPKQMTTQHSKNKEKHEEIVPTSTTTETVRSVNYPIPGRKFLPHQLPIYKPRVEAPNTLVVMDTITGPLSSLRLAMIEKKRIKVWTRNDTGFRGFVTGFLEVFDKHWNLGLRDVDETFQRRRRTKYPVHSGALVSRKPLLRSPKKKQQKSESRVPPPKSDKASSSASILVSGSSEDLLSFCRRKIENISIKEGSKGSNPPENSSKPPPTKSAQRKQSLTMFKNPVRDANGFVVVGQTKQYEIVERHVGQLFLMGNDVVLIETMR